MKDRLIRIHWNVFEKQWTVKTSFGCPRHPYVLVEGEWETEVKPHLKSNPRGFVKTRESRVQLLTKSEAELILNTHHSERLWYDKKEMTFSHNGGTCLLFLPHGAYLINKGV